MRLHESILDFSNVTIVEASDIRPSDKYIGYIEYSDVENYDIYDCKINNDQETENFINEAYKLHNELRKFRIEIYKLNKEKGKGDERWKNQ